MRRFWLSYPEPHRGGQATANRVRSCLALAAGSSSGSVFGSDDTRHQPVRYTQAHASSTSSTVFGSTLSLNHTTRAGRSSVLTPARSRFRRSEMARIRS